jgi:ubiquitin carboxyl-terminal hydrolase 4/11/15
MRVLSMFLSDQTYTLRRADELLEQTTASARSYALLPADFFAKARDW